MMSNVAVFLALLFLIICVVGAVAHSLHRGRVTLLAWSLLAMGGIYGAGWILVVLVTDYGGNPLWTRWLTRYERQYPLHTLSAFIAMSAVVAGWFFAGLPRLSQRAGRREPFSGQGRLHAAAWFLLLLAVVAQVLYSHAYGGLLGVLDYSILIRSGILTVSNPYSFLYPFAGTAMFSSFLFYGLIRIRRGYLVKVGFVVSFLFSLYVLTSWLGRIGFLAFLATFVLAGLLRRRVTPVPLIVGGGATMVSVVIAAYHVSVWLDLKSADSLPSFLARELSFPFVSFFAQLNFGEHLFRGFSDILVAPVYLLPSSWWIGWVENVSQVNTAVVMGAAKGEYGVTGGIPVDLVTLGLMQAGPWGIAVVALLYGTCLRLIERLLDGLRDHDVRAPLEAFVAIKIASLAIFYAHPEHVISNNFPFLFSAVVVAICIHVPRLRFVKGESLTPNQWQRPTQQP